MLKILSYTFEKRDEIEPLNGLRAVSVIGIILQHIWTFIVFRDLSQIPTLNVFMYNFNVFVDLFFLLSGFLIYSGLYHSYNKHDQIHYKDYFLKRTLRIFPAYYFLIICTAILFFAQLKILSSKPSLNEVETKILSALIERKMDWFFDIFYVSNYFYGNFAHNWTLAIEEQFYITLPFFLGLFLFKQPPDRKIKILILLYFLPLLFRIIHLIFNSSDYSVMDKYLSKYTHTRFDSLILGILIFELYTNYKTIFLKFEKYKFYLYLICAILFLPTLFLKMQDAPFFYSSIRYNLTNISFGIIFVFCLMEKSIFQKFFGLSVFRPISRISYSVYLWHILIGGATIGSLMNFKTQISWYMIIFNIIMTLLMSLVIGWILFTLIEYPFIRLKDRIKK